MVEGPRCIAFKPDEENLFLVGTEEGSIYVATTEYSTDFLMTYYSHKTPINAVMWNPYYSTVFISCAAEYIVHVWHKDFPLPIRRFDLGSQVGDIAWAPYSSTVFAAVTQDGRVVVFDLSVNKYNPVCNQVSLWTLFSVFQKEISFSQGILNQIAFNKSEPLLVVGDSKGVVHSVKLSPNLRKRTKEAEEALKENDEKRFKKLEVSKL